MPTQRVLKAGDRVAPPTITRTAYVGPSLTSRGPMAWGDKEQAAANAEAAASQAASESQGILAQALQQRRQPLPMAVDE